MIEQKNIYPREFKYSLDNAKLIFILKRADQIIVKAYENSSPNIVYRYVMTSANLPRSVRNNSAQLIKYFQETDNSPASKFQIEFEEKNAKLKIKNQITQILTLSQLDNQLIVFQEQQIELDYIIEELMNQINQLKRQGTQKDQQLRKAQIQKSAAQTQLENTNVLYKQKKDKFVGNDLELDNKYGKYIRKAGNKHSLFMKEMQVNDSMIKEIMEFDLRKIQVLSLGDNQITDSGFNFLFKEKGPAYWPVLFEIFLQNNKITRIHSLEGIQTLEKFAIYQNELVEESANYLCNYIWPEMIELRVSFKKGINDECWKKLLPNLSNNFPKLKQLWYSNEADLGPIMKKKILDHCNSNNLSLNHSLIGLQGLGVLGGLGGLGGGEGKNSLQALLKLQLLAQLLKGQPQQ